MAEERTLYVTNLDEKVTKELLHEIFTQAGPVESVSVINGATIYAFVQFEDEESVLYAIKLMDGLKLYQTPICVRPRANTEKDRIYRQQNSDRRRSSAGPSRRGSGNDYLPTYNPHSSGHRSLNENRQNAGPSRRESNVVPFNQSQCGRRSFNENLTRHNVGPSRKESMDVYQNQSGHRPFNESYPPIPLRLIQPHGQIYGQYPHNAVFPPPDPFRQRIIGGYYAQVPKSSNTNNQGGQQYYPAAQTFN
uniref:RRM domain-containing protein n=1 Tax=Panagrolaimus sp. PS1159 TaxID=55785 RepID=A0AC35GEK1_9BILA